MKNTKRKQETVQCDYCGIHFEKDSSEVKRNKQLARKIFCSRSCVGKNNTPILLLHRNMDRSGLNPSNRKDEFSLFRKHLRKIRDRDVNCNITLEDLLDIWNKQKGKCIYSKVELQPSKYKSSNNQIYTLSIDRIDSSKGYIKDNTQFISIAMNHMKNNMTHEQTLELIEILKNNNK